MSAAECMHGEVTLTVRVVSVNVTATVGDESVKSW